MGKPVHKAAVHTAALSSFCSPFLLCPGDFPNNLGVSWKLRPNPVGPGWGGAASTAPARIQAGSPKNTLGGLNRMVRGTVYIIVFPVSGLGLNII